jgi:hypothetical protein
MRSPKRAKKNWRRKCYATSPQAVLFLGRALKERLDCSLQPLPDELNILLEMLDGAERRRRIQATLNTKPMVKLDLPVDVH